MMNHTDVAAGATGSLAGHAQSPSSPVDAFPLSFVQESLWVTAQMAPANTAYNVIEAWRLTGALNVSSLRTAVDACVRRHEILRTVFGIINGRPMQVLLGAPPPALEIEQVGGEDELCSALAREARHVFDLQRGPLVRFRLFRLSDNEHALSLNLHHIICDEWSMERLWDDLATAYAAALAGSEISWPELPIQYADFAAWQRELAGSEAFCEQLRYWETKLAPPLPVMELPTDLPRPGVQGLCGATEFFHFDTELVKGLEALSRREGVTLFMTLLGAFQILLHRYTRQPELIVGTPLAARQRIETEGLVGCFANILPMRTDLQGNPTFREVLGRVRDVVSGAAAHQDVTSANILERTQPVRDLSRHPLFQVVLALQPASNRNLALPGMRARQLEVANGGAKFDWSLLLRPSDSGLQVQSEYSTDLFKPGTVARWVRQWETLLRSVLAKPAARISELSPLTDAEQRQIIADLNPGGARKASDRCLHEWFESQAASRPEAVALVCEGAHLTYGQLNGRANQLARHLRKLGVGPDLAVALCLERSLEMVVAILAVLKAGGYYVPLDPAAPAERLRFMLEDTQARWVLTQQSLSGKLPSGAVQLICLESEAAALSRESVEDLPLQTTSANSAYVIYTSGSTGKPKGVQVTHRNVVRLFEQTENWFQFDANDVWTLFHSYSFDFSVWELWGALLYGGRLVLVPHVLSRSPDDFLELLINEKVTVLNQTPSAFRQLLWAEQKQPQRRPLSLRYVVFGGEALELETLRAWFERHGDERPQLINMYGITETTVHVTYRPLRMADLQEGLGSVIGVPIPDLRLYLVDEYLQPVPPGIAGEICVGGEGVARGYLNRPELTAQRFVSDPFTAQPNARLYRSGDLARFTAAGELEYLGRIDEQVKLRGFRIELGEIETELNRHPKVQESVLLLERRGQDGRLLAYVVARAGMASPDAQELRGFLRQKLPDYMVPADFVLLPQLPLTTNGKVDRRALAAMAPNTELCQGNSEPPRNDLEKQVAEVWCEVLGRRGFGIHDNFFQAGGHSLLATQVMARLSAVLNLDLSIRLLFEAPTVAALAEALAKSRQEQSGGRAAIPRRQQSAEAGDLLQQLEQLSAEEIDAILGETGVGTISA